MTYTIVQPLVNTNTSYKDTGRLTFYKYEDLQVLAELFAQANACLVCDAGNDCRGGMTQDALYTTLWPYLGMYYDGSLYMPNFLAPEKQYLDRDRVQYMTDGTFDIPWAATMNDAWLYVTADPFANFSPYMHRDDRLSAAGTTSGTYALFGNGDVDMKAQDTAAELGLNMPFVFKAWTDPRDILSVYQDAKTLSEYDFNVLTWNSNITRNWALGQAFDQTFVSQDLQRNRRYVSLDWTGQRTTSDSTIYAGWENVVFGTREMWRKSAAYDGSRPDQYIYEWTSETDSLSVGAGHPTFERNVPIPTSNFGTECLQDRKVMFVWEAEVVEDITYSDSGIQPQVKTTSWYSFIGDFQKYGTADFVDHFGNNRGLCMKYTFPTTAMAQQHTSIKNLLNWTIPTFDQSWTPETSHYVTWQSKELNIYLRGCYSLQKSYLTEMLTRP